MAVRRGLPSPATARADADRWACQLLRTDRPVPRLEVLIGDRREKGSPGPDRRTDHSGDPLYLYFLALPEPDTFVPGDIAGHANLESWILRRTFLLDVSSPAAEPARWLQIVMMNVVPAAEHEFDDWYEQEHATRIAAAAPAFSAVSRFRAVAGNPQHLALWRLTDPTAPERDPWLAASETPWTQRIRRFMRDRRRLVFTPLPDHAV
ncbi:MAG: hypothetical protein AB7G13_16815 [Lautropia sp.]